ncbi:MAG: hypothetical protein N3E37_01755 [Candidatus Micrarchaeota archaeon]|nr:hypothetical protein [Candidatus Micrarchaeota archaeon]
MAKFPISKEAIETNELKGKDKENLEKNRISELDIQVAKILYPYLKNVENVEIVRALSSDESLITLLVKGKEEELFKNEGNCINALSKELKKKIRVVPLSDNHEMTLAALYNVKFVKTQEIFSKDNQHSSIKVYVKTSEKTHEKNLTELKSVMSYLYQKDVEIVKVE